MEHGPTTYRDHLLSVYQSAAADVARGAAARAADGPPGAAPLGRSMVGTGAAIEAAAAEVAGRRMQARRGVEPPPGAPLGPSVRSCAELGLQLLEAKVRGDGAEVARLTGEFTGGVCDPAWASTILEYAKYFGPNGTRRSVPYVRPAEAGEGVIEIKAGARVGLVSDWGTGAGPAREVMRHLAALAPDVLVHLGDIYYSGTPRECEANFRLVVDAAFAPEGAPPTYVLAGNHDMYCGGVGYYGLISSLNAGSKRQKASFFCLRSSDERWQVLAMDTGLHDYSPLSVNDAVTHIETEELEWHRRRVAEFDGKTILLSHHQAFSAFSAIGPADSQGRRDATNPNLMAAYRTLNAGSKVAAWFWGHEHNLCVYDRFGGVERGRCIGHGAVPVFATDDVYAPLADLADAPTLVPSTKLALDGGVWAHGFALLTLGEGGAPCRAEYHQVPTDDPSPLYVESIA